jgi:peptidylprolyl isomerase
MTVMIIAVSSLAFDIRSKGIQKRCRSLSHQTISMESSFCVLRDKYLQKAAMSLATVLISVQIPDILSDRGPHPPAASAVIAPLADVGLREFLVKNGKQLLNLALPTGPEMKIGTASNGDELKMAQEGIELVRLRLEQVGFTNPGAWGGALKDASTAETLIKKNRETLVSGAAVRSQQGEAQRIVDEELLPNVDKLISAVRKQDIQATSELQEAVGSQLAQLREMQLPKKSLPFKIPEEYGSLPRLLGRAEVDMTVVSGGRGFRLEDGKTIVPKIDFHIVVDGYRAPLTAGNFIDLVNRKWYDGMTFQKAEQLVLQTGKPSSGEGFIDPKTKQLRQIPLELFYKKDREPVYGITSDDDMRSTDAMALPFQAYGAVGMARSNEDVDSASSQFFLLKWDQALVAPGRNTLDGFYSEFGYVTENENLLSQITEKDKIVSMKVVKGIDNLVVP